MRDEFPENFEPDLDCDECLCPMGHNTFEDCVDCEVNECGDECVYNEDTTPETSKDEEAPKTC
jgi:hypothetical protein